MRHREVLYEWLRPLLLAALVAVATGGVLRSSALREDEFECEEAAAHLAECCDISMAGFDCQYSSACGFYSFPALTVRESTCIQETSCFELEQRGLCDLFDVDVHTTDTTASVYDRNADRLGVCP